MWLNTEKLHIHTLENVELMKEEENMFCKPLTVSALLHCVNYTAEFL